MKNLICVLILTISIVGCAQNKIKNEWSAKGYSKEDVKLIENYFGEYYDMSAAATSGTIMASSTSDKYRRIFCGCYAKLGEKCRENPTGLNAKDKDLWAKSNAAEMASAAHSGSNGIDGSPFSSSSGAIDPVECGSVSK